MISGFLDGSLHIANSAPSLAGLFVYVPHAAADAAPADLPQIAAPNARRLNEPKGCRSDTRSGTRLIVDLDKLLPAVMAPLHAALSHWDMAGPRPGQLCLCPEISSWHRTIWV